MKLDMFSPKIVIEDLSLSISKTCTTHIEQTHPKPQETLKNKLTQPVKSFSFTPPISIEASWMIGLRVLEV